MTCLINSYGNMPLVNLWGWSAFAATISKIDTAHAWVEGAVGLVSREITNQASIRYCMPSNTCSAFHGLVFPLMPGYRRFLLGICIAPMASQSRHWCLPQAKIQNLSKSHQRHYWAYANTWTHLTSDIFCSLPCWGEYWSSRAFLVWQKMRRWI